ncbi:MAG: aldo/keto reductase [Acidobacteriota bacterium]
MKKNGEDNSRRKFIKKGLSGIAAAAVLPSAIAGENPEGSKTKSSIIYRTFGKTGIKLPVVSMGVMNADNPKLVEAALDSGMTFLDTAHVYQRGKNEEMLGKVLKGKKRDSFFIATKVPGNFSDRKTGLFTDKTDPKDFLKKFDISMKRLGLEYVDVLYLHSVKRKESVTFEPLLKTMLKLKKEGRVKFIGVSTHKNEPEVIRAAADSGVHDVVLTAYNFLQPHIKEIDDAVNYAAGKGLGIVAMKTQAGVYWDKERLNPINMKAALKWALQNKNIHTSIPGFSTFDQMETDLEVMRDIKITDKERIDLKLKPEVAGLYCSQCDKCITQCSKGVDIPTLMRSYMYAFGYRNLIQAKDTLADLDLNNLPCNDCATCEVKCVNGLNIKDRIIEVSGISKIPDQFLV